MSWMHRQKSSNAAPDSVTVLKNIWSWEKQSDGTLVITSYKGTSTDIVVPSMIDKSIVMAIGEKAFSPKAPKLTEDQKEFRSTISKVTFPDSIRSISEHAFTGCRSLEEMVIPEGVVEIGRDAFSHCEKLTEIIIPSTVKLIGYRAFIGCYALRSVKLPEGIDEIPHGMFQYCASLKSITLPATIQRIGIMAFCQCSSLEEIVIPKGTVRIGARAFENCSTLKTVVIPASVKSVGRKKETECHIFCGSYNVTVIVEPGSCAEEYCKQNYISFRYGKDADVVAAHQSNI